MTIHINRGCPDPRPLPVLSIAIDTKPPGGGRLLIQENGTVSMGTSLPDTFIVGGGGIRCNFNRHDLITALRRAIAMLEAS